MQDQEIDTQQCRILRQADEISSIKSKISILETRVSYSQIEITRLQDKANLAASDVQNNASKMKALSCAI